MLAPVDNKLPPSARWKHEKLLALATRTQALRDGLADQQERVRALIADEQRSLTIFDRRWKFGSIIHL